ncbi:hypothetical protein VIB_002502 [Vibrio metschnikovii CIP 69.14]|nr:hypothetical protein VIB_002502 [Vibrio metschnikovii CIP 69.14]
MVDLLGNGMIKQHARMSGRYRDVIRHASYFGFLYGNGAIGVQLITQ